MSRVLYILHDWIRRGRIGAKRGVRRSDHVDDEAPFRGSADMGNFNKALIILPIVFAVLIAVGILTS